MTSLGIGIDVGSTTTKGVLIDQDLKIKAKHLLQTGASASSAVTKVMTALEELYGQSLDTIPIISTGYGRSRVENAGKSVTEITCHSIGVYSLNPEIRLLIDIGCCDS